MEHKQEASDSNPFPEIEIVHLPSSLRRVGKWLNKLVLGPHLFSPVSEYFQEHPFDNELYGRLGETHDGITVRECPDLEGRDIHLIGMNQMFFPEEDDGTLS